jgi:hypothetical protein
MRARRGVAQPGSASALGAEGREFESHRPDQIQNKLLFSSFLLLSEKSEASVLCP